MHPLCESVGQVRTQSALRTPWASTAWQGSGRIWGTSSLPHAKLLQAEYTLTETSRLFTARNAAVKLVREGFMKLLNLSLFAALSLASMGRLFRTPTRCQRLPTAAHAWRGHTSRASAGLSHAPITVDTPQTARIAAPATDAGGSTCARGVSSRSLRPARLGQLPSSRLHAMHRECACPLG
jgi:hypothetical protein